MSTRLPDTLKVEDELFALGLDSLKAAKIVRHINASLEEIGRGGGPRFLPSTIYANPSVSQMASKVIAMTWEDSQTNDTPSARDRVTDRRSLSVQYGQDLPMNGRKAKEVNPKTPEVLILTGSTGSVGSYLLDALLKDQSISKVYCFNRANNTAPELYFGLSRSIYLQLLQSTTHILHNAWEVNFNLSLGSFQPHVNGGRKLVDLSAHSTYGASIFFVSTISTVMKWPVNHTGKMPEAVIDDWSLPQPMGYAESKYVSERLLEEASRVSDVLGKICRVRQVAGPTSQMGHWIMREWFPGLIASSAFMGVIPENLGPMEMVDWVPVDLLSKIILDLFLRQEVQGQHDNVASHAGESTPLDESCEESKTNSAVNSSAETTASNHNQGVTVASTNGTTNHTILQTISATTTVYHAIDPHQTTYSSLLPTILSHLPPQATPIGLDEWVRKLEHSEQDLEHNPASKLLDFFKALVEMACQGLKMVVLDIEGTVRESATLRGMGEVEAGWMGNWMRGWGWGWGY